MFPLKDNMKLTRRSFLAAAATAAGFPLCGIEPLKRRAPMIKGLGLAAYSLRQQMKYGKGSGEPGPLDLLGFLDYCADLRLEEAELTAYFFPPEVKPEYLRELKRRAHILGLDLSSGAIGNNFTHEPGSPKAVEQLDYTRNWINHYAELGVSVIRIFAGNPAAGVSTDQAIKNAIANLQPALEHAEKRGVLLALENHDFTTKVDNLIAILKAVDSKWLGALMDSGNLRGSADPYADLARIAPYAIAAQVKASIPMGESKAPTDYGKVVKILNDAEYSGYLVLEYEETEDPYVAIPKHIHSIRRAMIENLPLARFPQK
jgi:sugar phosphate isomerase/epimerase